MMRVRGYVSREPGLRHTQQGDKVLGISVPYTPRRFDKNRDEWVDAGPTLWTQAALWGADAEAFDGKLAKGTFVVVEGEPVLRTWEKDGRTGTNLELKFAQVSIVPAPPRRDGPQQFPEQESTGWAVPGAFGDDEPF